MPELRLFGNRLADSIQLMQKNDIEQSNCIEKQGNIIEEKGGMRKKWLRFALSSIC